MRRRVITLTLALLLLVPDWPGASPAFAHGLGQSTDLPIPLWLFLYGAGAAVLLSFIPISQLGNERRAPRGYPRFDLLRVGPLRALLAARPFLFGLRLLSVALFLLVVLSGLLGRQDPGSNFAPTFVWITWWVGFSFFTAFVGNVWPLVNPWKILFEWAQALVRRLGAKGGLELGVSYPASWGVWPAVALYAAFVWVENVFAGPFEPLSVAVLVLNYSVLTWGGMVVYGKEAWLRNGEAFSVFFGLLARFAPTEVRVKGAGPCRDCANACGTVEGECVNCYECFAATAPEDRELNLRPPAVGLARPEPLPPGGTFFVILVLAGVAYDGLLNTPLWFAVRSVLPSLSPTLGLVALPLLFLGVYMGFVKLSQLFGGGKGRAGYASLVRAYAYTLVPIAVAYQVAHYFTYLLIEGQAIVHHLSDPFGRGWDLFGTGDYAIKSGLLEADTVWYLQVVLIVAGHVIAVYLAHLVALRLLGDRRRALLSQLPMLALMVLYTVFSLWILSQKEVTPTESAPQLAPIEVPFVEDPSESTD